MRLLPLLVFLGLASARSLGGGHHDGPEIFATNNKIEDCEMSQAIECLQEQICNRRNIPHHGKIRCTIGSAVAYVCNYKHHKDKLPDHQLFGGERGGELACHSADLYEAWRQIRIGKGSQTGWWHDKAGKRTFGFDKRCKSHECDNGWKKGSEHEQCTNIHKKSHKEPWLFDFEAPVYPNYTGKYEQDLPEPGDVTEPVYFNPWFEGKRPTRLLGEKVEWAGWEPGEKVEWADQDVGQKVEWNGWEPGEKVEWTPQPFPAEWSGWGPDPVDEWTPRWAVPGAYMPGDSDDDE